MARMTLVALLALCVVAPALGAQGARESLEEGAKPPPENFPANKAEPFSASRVPTAKPPLEALDLKNAAGANETERVDHPNVIDPGTTHAEDKEPVGGGSIRACTLPSSLRQSNSSASASDWLADNGNGTKVCHLPVKWLHGASGTLRVCSIPHDAWNSSITITNGTIPKELLAQINTTGVKCVTPSEALSGNGSARAVVNGSIPSAWLRESNDTIYIYIIPQEWLRDVPAPAPSTAPQPSGPASEVEDLTRDSLDAASPTPGPPAATTPNTTASTTNTTASANATAAANATASVSNTTAAAATTASPADVTSNAAGVNAATASSAAAKENATPAPISANSTNNTAPTTSVAPAVANVNNASSTSAPAVAVPAVSANTTEKPKEEETKPTDKPKPTTKPVVKPKESTPKPIAKPAEETTKAAEKPAVQTTEATRKSEEKATEPGEEKTTEKPKETTKPDQHPDTENEIGHGGAAALSQENSHQNQVESSAKTAFLQPTESAAILAGVFVAIALLGYAGLLLWRRVLEKRYGNREMLVNEDDDFDTSDMRHFEL